MTTTPCRSRAVLRPVATVAAVLAAATSASVIASSADARVSINAKLTQGNGAPFLQLTGNRDGRKTDRYAIRGSFRAIPCPGRKSRLVIANSAGPPRASYEATFVLRRTGGDRLRCGVRLPRNLGRKLLRLQVYGVGATPTESLIVVEGRRTGAMSINGSFTTSDLLCDRAYRLRVQLSAPSRRITVLYDMRMQKVRIAGRPCG